MVLFVHWRVFTNKIPMKFCMNHLLLGYIPSIINWDIPSIGYQWHLNELVYHLLLIPYCLFGHGNSPFCFIQTHPRKAATGRLLFRKSRRNIFDHNGQGPDEKPRGWFCWVILWESDGICRAFTGSFAQALSIWSRTWNLFCLICLGSWLALKT